MESIHVLLLAIFGFIGYYVFFVVKKPKVTTGNENLRKFLRTHVKAVNETYWPALFHWEGRLQSILGLTRRVTRPGKLPYERQIFDLADGGQLALDYLEPESIGVKVSGDTKRPIVLLLPGLTNSSQTSYVKTLAMSIVTAGASLVVYNNRGIGGVPLKTAQTYCASKYSDLREVILHLKQKYPEEKMVVIGASLGGMMLCQYLINHPEESKETFSAAMLISVVWDAMAGIESIEKPGMNWIVNTGMAESLKGLARKHQKTLELRNDCSWNFPHIMQSKTLREFDTRFTAPQFGYQSVWDYYKDCTIVERVGAFALPVFSLNANDDPMQPGKDLPLRGAMSETSNLAFITTNRGGHLGFLEGMLPTKKSFHFSERLVMDWIRALTLHGHELTAQ